MIGFNRLSILIIFVVALSVAATQAIAQHLDILVQDVTGKLTTGTADFVSGGYSLGIRVFTSQFPTSFVEDDPGWNAIQAGSTSLPPGADALTGSTDLAWDFLPMTVLSLSSNLLYWDAVGATQDDVSFGAAPGDEYKLTLYGKDGESAAADGSDQFVAGHVIDTTAANGYLHKHRFFYLDDGDGNIETTPETGIYLIAMQLRMAVLETSDPFYLLWSTPGVPLSTLNGIARPWVDSRVDQLVRDSLAGDFDGDGDVDGNDFLAWQIGFGTQTGAQKSDGDYDNDGDVDEDDFIGWQAEFGLGGGAASIVVPEPATIMLSFVLMAVGMLSSGVRIG